MHLSSDYQSPYPFSNGHLETLIPYFFRKPAPCAYQRQRINTPDGDFLDLDWLKSGHQQLVILSHGLEGCSRSNYVQGLANFLNPKGFDILAWNNRGCSGEMNRKIKMYHSGASHDLRTVVDCALAENQYSKIYLVGFSMGGNITLKYLGEEGTSINSRIKKAVAVSTPVCLADSAAALSQGFGFIYTKHFLRRIIKKLQLKKKQIPDFNPNIKKLNKICTFAEFDDQITAPINGFKNAKDYYNKASSINFIPDIKVKTLIINALNDPFLKDRCFPYDLTKNHPFVDLETPLRGGHVSFPGTKKHNSWIELRIFNYLKAQET